MLLRKWMVKAYGQNDGLCPEVRQTDSPWWMDSNWTSARWTDIKATWCLHGLGGPQEALDGNILHPMVNPSQQNLYMRIISQNMCIYEDLPPQGNIFFAKKQKSILHYYKNSKPSENKVRIIYPNSGILELQKFSNLTFGGDLVGTTPVLSARFPFYLLHRFCFEYVKIVRLTDDLRHYHTGSFLMPYEHYLHPNIKEIDISSNYL